MGIYRILCGSAVVVAMLLTSAELTSAQSVSLQSLQSKILHQHRKIRIRLPPSYERMTDSRYPVVIALDGEYLFYSLTAAANILELYQVMPEVIVVGIDQNYPDAVGDEARWTDCSYDKERGRLTEKGREFRSFIAGELLPYVDRTYRTARFRAVAGHSLTATCASFFLVERTPTFQGYIAISPNVPSTLRGPLTSAAEAASGEIFLFLSTGTEDLSEHVTSVKDLDRAALSKVRNPKFRYRFEDYLGANHMSLVNRSVEAALGHIFERYSLVRREESGRKEFLRSPVKYLEQKYADVERIYDVTLNFREEDLRAGRLALSRSKNWTGLAELARFTLQSMPASAEGDFMMRDYHRGKGDLRSAVRAQQQGCEKLVIGSRARKRCDSAIGDLRAAMSR